MRWWMAVAAVGIGGIATWLYRVAAWEDHEPEREYEACTRRPPQPARVRPRQHEEWRNHQPGDWR